MKKSSDVFLKYIMGLNMKHMKWFTQCFYISRFIHPIFFGAKCALIFCWMRCNVCSYKKEKSDNSDEDHHNQVNYFIITVALKIFFSCNKNRLKAVDANYATLQNCTKNH